MLKEEEKGLDTFRAPGPQLTPEIPLGAPQWWHGTKVRHPGTSIFPMGQAASFSAPPALQLMEEGAGSQNRAVVKGTGFELDSGSNPSIIT